MDSPQKLLPANLKGPRSYFTDLDPRDRSYEQTEVLRKLKLQLLTKERIVIAASAIFHDMGMELFANDKGLTEALNRGIIAPAIRNEFPDVKEFFGNKTETGYSVASRTYFEQNVGAFVSWDLNENTSWFHRIFVQNVSDEQSLVRSRLLLSSDEVESLLNSLKVLASKRAPGQQFLRREDIDSAARKFGQESHEYLVNFANLVYRLSGARVVNSEGHFPQSNLINLGVVGNDHLLSDSRVFWELFVEAVISNLTSAVRLTQNRLDSLSFLDILKVREDLFDTLFADTFDTLMQKAKDDAQIHDPERLLMKQEEIATISAGLAKRLEERISSELGRRNIDNDAEGLFQIASAFELVSGGVVIGTIGALKSIPQITSMFSPKLAEAINSRALKARRIVVNLIGWNPKQKKALLSGYEALLNYGLPRK